MHRITRYTLPAALCVTLLTVSPGLAGAADAPAKPSTPVAKKALPGAEALTAQVESLGSAGSLITPVTNFLGEVLKSPDGKLPDADLAVHKQKIDAALAGLKKTFAAAAPAAPTTPGAGAEHPAALVVLPEPPADAPKPPVDGARPPGHTARPPADTAKPPAEAAKPPVEVAKPPADTAKPPADTARPPADAARPPADAARPPADAARPPAHAARPPADAAKPPAAVAKPPADAAKPAEAAKPPAGLAQPVTLPVAVPAHAPGAVKPKAAAPLDRVTAAVDHLKASVDEVAKAAGPCDCTIDAARVTDVVNDLGTTVVALFSGLGLPGMPAAAPDSAAPAAPAPDPAE